MLVQLPGRRISLNDSSFQLQKDNHRRKSASLLFIFVLMARIILSVLKLQVQRHFSDILLFTRQTELIGCSYLETCREALKSFCWMAWRILPENIRWEVHKTKGYLETKLTKFRFIHFNRSVQCANTRWSFLGTCRITNITNVIKLPRKTM